MRKYMRLVVYGVMRRLTIPENTFSHMDGLAHPGHKTNKGMWYALSMMFLHDYMFDATICRKFMQEIC